MMKLKTKIILSLNLPVKAVIGEGAEGDRLVFGDVVKVHRVERPTLRLRLPTRRNPTGIVQRSRVDPMPTRQDEGHPRQSRRVSLDDA